jgi:cytochrome c biogenesis protein CcmG/thiol:disulfide interchange protein DsbE
MTRPTLFVPLLVFLGISAGFGLSLWNDPSKLPTMLMDKRAPDFTLPGLEGGKPGLASTDLGSRVTLVNVFASWCGSCQIEHPTLLSLAKDPDVTLFGIDWKDEPEKGAQWLAQLQNPYQLVGNDRSGRVGIDFGVSGVPETFVIDPSGRIRYRHAGPITPEIWAETFEPLIAKIKSEPRS